MRIEVKVCGLTRADDVRGVIAAGATAVGAIFVPSSPRYCLDKLDPDEFMSASFGAVRVGVFSNSDSDEIQRMTQTFGLNAVQLHGSESPTFCRNLRKQLRGPQVWKTIPMREGSPLYDWGPFQDACDCFLFDTAGPNGAGGTGKQFSWNALDAYNGPLPFIVAGGVGPEKVRQLLLSLHAHSFFRGIDLNSRVETAPGVKSTSLVEKTMQEVRHVLRGR